MKNFMAVFVCLLPSLGWTQDNAPTTPTIYEVSTTFSERDMAISPDGTEMLYTIATGHHVFSTIVYRRREKRGWSKPVIAPFSGKFKDLEPAFSPDGKKIFFSSNRPVEGKSSRDFDIWVVEKKNGKWSSEASNLGAPINTEKDEFYPSVATSGNIYYTAEHGSGVGKEDIWVSSLIDGAYTQPVALDTMVNSKHWEFNAFVSYDEKFILFTSYGRKGDSGGGDLYISFRNENGSWEKAKALTLNSPRLDYCPFVTADGRTMFFTSQRHSIEATHEKKLTYDEFLLVLKSVENGTDNIYWISFEEVLKSIH
jgi:Tol biopolymer transport system component